MSASLENAGESSGEHCRWGWDDMCRFFSAELPGKVRGHLLTSGSSSDGDSQLGIFHTAIAVTGIAQLTQYEAESMDDAFVASVDTGMHRAPAGDNDG